MSTTAKHKIGDVLITRNGHKGEIFHVYFNEASKEWVYCFKHPEGLGCVRESNIKKNGK